MAPSSLISTVARQSTSSAGLPRPSGSTLVSHRPSTASGLHSSGCALSLWLCQAPPSLRLHHGLPDPRFGRRSHLLRLGSLDPPHRPGSSALCLCLGLHHHLLDCHRSAPWSRQPFLHHGSSLRLHCGLPSWLRPGSCLAPPAPSPSCPLPGSSLHQLHPGLCLSSSSWVSVLRPNLLQLCLPAFLPAVPCHHPFSTPCVLLLIPPPSLPLSLCHEVAPSRRGANCHTLGRSVVFSFPMCSLWPSFPSMSDDCNLVQVCLVYLQLPMYLSCVQSCVPSSGLLCSYMCILPVRPVSTLLWIIKEYFASIFAFFVC